MVLTRWTVNFQLSIIVIPRRWPREQGAGAQSRALAASSGAPIFIDAGFCWNGAPRYGISAARRHPGPPRTHEAEPAFE